MAIISRTKDDNPTRSSQGTSKQPRSWLDNTTNTTTQTFKSKVSQKGKLMSIEINYLNFRSSIPEKVVYFKHKIVFLVVPKSHEGCK